MLNGLFGNFGFGDTDEAMGRKKAGSGVNIYRNDMDGTDISASLRRLFKKHGITMTAETAQYYTVTFPDDWTKDSIASMITEVSYKNGTGQFIFSSCTQYNTDHWTNIPAQATKAPKTKAAPKGKKK